VQGTQFGRVCTRSSTCLNGCVCGGGGGIHKTGDGRLTQLWNDVCMESTPLRVCFPRLFEVYDNKEGTVAEYAANDWQLNLRRMLGEEEMSEWTDLQTKLRRVILTQHDDEVIWGLTLSKVFTMGSLYKFMTSGGMDNRLAIKI
jgi:hypothetical protein